MMRVFVALAFVIASSGAVLAEGEVVAGSQAVTPTGWPADGETVQRRANEADRTAGGLQLRMATVKDVDLDGDGIVSFDELERFDFSKDF